MSAVETTTPARAPAQSPDFVPELAARMGRDSLVYAVVLFAIFPISLINTAVTTHFLSTAQFGQVGVLFFWSGMLTLILNVAFMRGVELRVWSSDDEGIDIKDQAPVEAARRPIVLGTGMMLTIGLAALTFAPILIFAPGLSRAMFGRTGLEAAVIWAGVSGAVGAIWRLATQVPRWERRPKIYGVQYVSRSALAVPLTWGLLEAGFGVGGVIAATAGATIVSALFSLVQERRAYRVQFDRHAASDIWWAGAPLIGLIVGLNIIHSSDIYLVSVAANNAQAGLFRLASNITSVVSYAVSAFLFAWAPLEGSSLFRAVYERYGKRLLHSLYLEYYLIIGTFIVVALSVAAVPIVDAIAPRRYGGAVHLVPVGGVAFLAYGLILVVARQAKFPRRGLVYGSAALGGAAILVPTALILGSAIGAYGVAIADVVGALVAVIVIVTVSTVVGEPPLVDLRRVAGTLLIGGGCYALGVPLARQAGSLELPLQVAAILLYPTLLVVTRIVPASDRRLLWAAVKVARARGRQREPLIRATMALPLEQRSVLVAATRERRSRDQLEAISQLGYTQLNTTVVAALRSITGTEPQNRFDSLLGEALLADVPTTQRDGLLRKLFEGNLISATDVHIIESAFSTLRSAPQKIWSSVLIDGTARLPPPPWSIEPIAVEALDETVREHQPRQLVAARLDMTEDLLDTTLVSAVRTLAGVATNDAADRLIAAFLFDEHDPPSSSELWAARVDPIAIHELDVIVAAIRTLPTQRWEEIRSYTSTTRSASLPNR